MDTIVEETQIETQTDPNAEKSFGEIMQDRLEQKTSKAKETTDVKEPATATPDATKSKQVVEPETKTDDKKVTKEATSAVTPVGDVLDAALSQAEPAKERAKEPVSPVDEFKDVTEGVTSAKVKERMVGMRTKIGSLWEENQTLKRQTAELQGKVKPALEDPEVQQLLKAKEDEIARASEALLALNIDAHPEFQREFVQPREKLARSAAQKLQSYGGNGQALLDALYMPEGIRRDEAIAQLTENVPDYAKGKITGIVTQIEALDEKAAERRANAPKTWEELNAKDLDARRKKVEEYRGQVKGVFEEVTRHLAETSPIFRQLGDDVKGSSEWNKETQAAFERGLNHILGNDNTIQRSLVTAIKGERYDIVEKMLVEERKLRREAEKRVAEYESVQPTVRGTRGPETSESEEEKSLGFGDLVARRAARRSAEAD